MPYPETFEGFRVNSNEKWSEFEKQEVGHRGLRECLHRARVNPVYSSNRSRLKNGILTSRSYAFPCITQEIRLTIRRTLVVFAALMSIPSLVAGERFLYPCALAMRS